MRFLISNFEINANHSLGTVVRVGPNEVSSSTPEPKDADRCNEFQLHFSDPRAYNDIYGIGTRFVKQKDMYSCFATDKSVFAMHDHKLAMQLRAAIGPFFSRKAILSLENVIQAKVYLVHNQLVPQITHNLAFRSIISFRVFSPTPPLRPTWTWHSAPSLSRSSPLTVLPARPMHWMLQTSVTPFCLPLTTLYP